VIGGLRAFISALPRKGMQRTSPAGDSSGRPQSIGGTVFVGRGITGVVPADSTHRIPGYT
jgi:hypothetical protein